MDELQKRGGQLLYDPAFRVWRRPRPTLKSFFKMLFNYGRGRAEQFRTHPTPGSVLNLVPPLFVLYLALLPLGLLLLPGMGRWLCLPLSFYTMALLGQTLANLGTHGAGRSGLALPLLGAAHMLYGLGFWRGLATKLNKDRRAVASEVQMEVIPHA